MASSSLVLQNLLLPFEDRFDSCHGLFFNSGATTLPSDPHLTDDKGKYIEVPVSEEGLTLDREAGELHIAAGTTVSFCTYLNMCSTHKWSTLTHAHDIALFLDIAGTGTIVLKGFSADDITNKQYMEGFDEEPYADRVTTATVEQIARVPFDRTDATDTLRVDAAIPATPLLVGFEIVAQTDCVLTGGSFQATIDDDLLNTVELGLATTTFKKEEFITANLAMLEREIFSTECDLAKHFSIFVVDNGSTLDPKQFENDHLSVFPNKNVGGSGGFSRGMIEAMRSGKNITNLLIMDDDVLILSESIKRMYALLRCLKEEYQGRYVSGAMLRLERMNEQHEDIGYVHPGGYNTTLKGELNLFDVRNCALNEVEWPKLPNRYAGWWFCCIPMRYITEQTLPLPLFIRGDDIEYSLRNDPDFLTMNGICVWHVGFSQKYSASMELYQVIRNDLIDQSMADVARDVEYYRQAQLLFRGQLCQFQYDYASLVLDAIEDYLKGPALLEDLDGAAVIGEKGKRNEKLVPLDELPALPADANPDDEDTFTDWVYEDRKRSALARLMHHLSYNGQRFKIPSKNRELGRTPYDWFVTPGYQQGADRILAINPQNNTGALREMDKDRFATEMARAQELFTRFDAEHKRVDKEWRDAYPRMTSVEFWKKYLGID